MKAWLHHGMLEFHKNSIFNGDIALKNRGPVRNAQQAA
jgi:hypothetical protein